MNVLPKERLKQIYDNTIESGDYYSEKIDDIDFYSLLCKATASNNLYKIVGCNLCMFKTLYNESDSILILFSIPVSVNTDVVSDNKHVSERIMEILKIIEDCFITVEYLNAKDIKEEKFVYILVVKKIKED